MRILLLHPYSWPRTRRGGERYLHDLGWYLAGAGHDVTILTGAGPQEGPAAETIEGCTVQRRWRRPDGRARRLPARARYRLEVGRIRKVLDGPVDVVHALWPAAAEAAARAGHPTVYTLLGMVTDRTPDADPGLLPVVGRAAATASHCAALSDDARHHAERLLGGRWSVLPPGIRTDRFLPRLHRPPGPPRFLFSASLEIRYKGLDVLLQAMGRVLDAHPDARLQLSGQGDPAWALETLAGADRERVRAAIDLPGEGTLDAADARYADATATVLPAREEAFGLSVVESLAVGTPVVVADHGGPAEIVGTSPVGARVPYGDAPALARAMVETVALARRPGTATACVERARRWDWASSVGPLHEQVYEAVARGRVPVTA